MQEMMAFIVWFLQQLPEFLLTPPISAFTAFAVLFMLTALFRRMVHI